MEKDIKIWATTNNPVIHYRYCPAEVNGILHVVVVESLRKFSEINLKIRHR